MEFFATLCLIVLISIIAIWARIEGRIKKDPVHESELSADDFDILD